MAEAFIRLPARNETVRHRNGDVEDCRAANLLIVRSRGPSYIDLLRAKQLKQDGLSYQAVRKLTGVSRNALTTSKRAEEP